MYFCGAEQAVGMSWKQGAKRMKLCVTANIISGCANGKNDQFAETLSFLKAAGFEEIDFPFSTPMMLQEDWKEDFRIKRTIAEEAGVRIRYAHLPFDYPAEGRGYGWEEFRTASCRAIELACGAGVDCAAIHPRTWMTRDYDAAREYESAVEFLSFYCGYARQEGLTLAIENMRGPGRSAPKEIMRFGTETDDLIRMPDELGAGICWDTGHGHISGQPQRESLMKIGSRLKMVHINDNFAEDDVHIAPFIGSVQWDEAAAGLKAAGFAGSLNLEVGCRKLPEELRAGYAAYMASAARKIAEMIG